MIMTIFQILIFIFCLLIAPIGVILGFILYWLFGFWIGVFGFIAGLLIHIFGLEDLWALQKIALSYLLIGLLHLMWPAIFIALYIFMVKK